LFDRPDQGEAVEVKRVAFGEEKLIDLFVETFWVQAEDFGGVDRQRTVDKNRNARDSAFVEQIVQDIDQELGAFDGECWDDYLAFVLQCLLEDALDSLVRLWRHFMLASAIGALH
jgi:hypothetical protein